MIKTSSWDKEIETIEGHNDEIFDRGFKEPAKLNMDKEIKFKEFIMVYKYNLLNPAESKIPYYTLEIKCKFEDVTVIHNEKIPNRIVVYNNYYPSQQRQYICDEVRFDDEKVSYPYAMCTINVSMETQENLARKNHELWLMDEISDAEFARVLMICGAIETPPLSIIIDPK